MVKRSRLKKGSKRKKERMNKDNSEIWLGSTGSSHQPKESLHVMNVLERGKKSLEETTKELARGGGSFLHELIFLETPEEEHGRKLVSYAKGIIAKNPDATVRLQVRLSNEPDVGAGIHMVVSAEDLVHFKELEAEDVDSGNIYPVRRSDIFKIVGVVKEPKEM